jgi:hypothetical protein
MTLLNALIALPLLSCPAATVPTAGIDRAQVDATAKWVAHFDVEAFRATQLFQEIKAADKEGELDKALSEVAEEHGIQVLDDVFSVTAYGTALGEEHGVVLVQANAHVEAALAAAQEKNGAKSLRIREHDSLQWGAGAESGFSCLLPSTGDRRQIVLTKTQADLEQALDVLDKKRPALDSTPQSDLYAPPAAGSFAFVAATGILEELAGPHGHEIKQVSAAARLAKGLRIDLGETSGNVYLDLRLRTEKPEDAQRIQKVFEGLLALPGIIHGDDSEAGEVIDRLTKAINVEALNEIAHVRFQYASKALLGEIQKLQGLDIEEHAEQHMKSLHGGRKPKEDPK